MRGCDGSGRAERALQDRRSTPAGSPHAGPAERVAPIERLRRERLTGEAIAGKLGLKRSTVGGILRRLGLGRLAALDPKPPVIRSERETPGELVLIDTKKLGRIGRPSHRVTGNRRDAVRGAGWDLRFHVAYRRRSRLAYSEVLPSRRE